MHRGWAVPLILVVVAASCSGDEGGDDAAAGSLVDALELVPDITGVRDQVVYGSLERVRTLGGNVEPSDVRDDIGELMEVTTAFVVAEPFQRAAATIEDDELGFDLTAIDASMQAGAPPDDISVFLGRIEADRVDQAMTTFEPFAEELEQEERDGVQLYRFGEETDFDPQRITPARPLGVGGRFAVDGSTVWMTEKDATLDAVADLATGEGESLADVDGFREVGDALDAAEAYTAVMVGTPELLRFDPVTLLGERATPEMIEELTERFEGRALAPWDVVGLGEGFVEGDPDDEQLMIVLWHADDAAAEENESALATALAEGASVVTNKPWSEVCADADVVRDGALVTATCTPEAPGLALNIILTRDVLLAWD